MDEPNRYLQLERRLRDIATDGPRCLRPAHLARGEQHRAWIGTADRVPPQDDGTVEATSEANASRTGRAWKVAAFDYGEPIELSVDERLAESAPATAPGTVSNGMPPPASSEPVTARAVSPPAPEGLRGSDPADLESDDDFVRRIRELVERANDTPTSPPAAPPTPTGGPTAPPTPADVASAPTAPASSTQAAPSEPGDRYAIFESIGQSLAQPRTFDLGSVPVSTAFQAIDDAIDREERRTVDRLTGPATPLGTAPPLDQMDILEDLALMPGPGRPPAAGHGADHPIGGQFAEASPAAAPAPSAEPLIAQASAKPAWRDYHPVASNTMVVDGTEFPAPAGVRWLNWSAPGVQQFRGRPGQRIRALPEVRQLVLHETGGARWEGVRDPNLGVQLHIDRDGTVVQHNDVVDMLYHIKTFSEGSVGIELVNLAFDTDPLPDKDELDPGERVKVAWSYKKLGEYYTLPPLRQVEALALTVAALRTRLPVQDNWPQVIPHPDPAKRTAMAGRSFFLLRTGGQLYFTTIGQQSWICSQSALRDHDDGAFPALYCFLRLHKGMVAADAYQMARQVIEDPGDMRRQTYYDSKSGANLQLVDITDLA